MRSCNIKYYLVTGALAAGVAACNPASPSGSLPGNGTNAALPLGGTNPALDPTLVARAIHPPIDGAQPLPFAFHPNHRKSWISSDAKTATRLLFISDADAQTIDIFKLPGLALKGQITNPEVELPYGMCEDAQSNVWVADPGRQEMLQFTHTGALLNTLSISGWPWSCAVNKKNGDLAVMMYENDSHRIGDVQIFRHARGLPVHHKDVNEPARYYYGGYDQQGDLFVDGLNGTSSLFTLQELRPHASSLQTIGVTGGSIDFGGFVQWYGSGLAVGDQYCYFYDEGTACVYRLSLSGSTATITGVTKLYDRKHHPICSIPQGVIAGQGLFAGGDFDFCDTGAESLPFRWAFPAGGKPTNVGTAHVQYPIGSAISAK